ncbi:MAG: preprotein translocase subunit YajC [Beggiatoa sp. IS2]|nr:MAG: preprotein translocase subunit YajC [Beggiatoa sp. IS2]
MEFFIQNAWADGAPAAGGGPIVNILMLVFLFVVFYFLLIRPQQKRVKEHRQMVESLAKGDEIVTNGGLLGKITGLNDNFVAIEIAPNIEVRIQRQSVAMVMPKGTIKDITKI